MSTANLVILLPPYKVAMQQLVAIPLFERLHLKASCCSLTEHLNSKTPQNQKEKMSAQYGLMKFFIAQTTIQQEIRKQGGRFSKYILYFQMNSH